MRTLDDRLDEARLAVRSVPERAPQPFEAVLRRARRGRAAGAVAGCLAVAGIVVSVAVIGGDSPSLVSTDSVEQTESTSNDSGVTVPTTSSTAVSPPTTPVATVVAGDGVPAVVPVELPGGPLMMIPGAWGPTAVLTVGAASITVEAAPWAATVTDLGPTSTPGTGSGGAVNFFATLPQSPRLGPLGPSVTVEADGDDAVLTAVIGGRDVEVKGRADNGSLMNLLRSVTTTDRIAPIRPTSAIVAIPDVAGLDYEDATARLQRLDLRVLWALDFDTDVTLGTVVASNPDPATSAAVGSAVVLQVAAPSAPTGSRLGFTSVGGLDDRLGPPGTSLGFIDSSAGELSGSGLEMARDSSGFELPVVFLRGELVGTFTVGDTQNSSAVAALTDLVDPNWLRPQWPSGIDPATIALTQHVDHDGVHLVAPNDWTVIEDGACPVTRAVVIITAIGTRCAFAAGPWVTLQPAPAVPTPCAKGTPDSNTCQLDTRSDAAHTRRFIQLGTGVQVTVVGTEDSQESAEIQAVLASIVGPTPTAKPSNDPFDIGLVLDAVSALLGGDCAHLATVVAPDSALSSDCTAVDPEVVSHDDFSMMATSSNIDIRDPSRRASEVFDTRVAGTRSWIVETRDFYDPTTMNTIRLISYLTDEHGIAVISPTSGPTPVRLPDVADCLTGTESGLSLDSGCWLDLADAQDADEYRSSYVGDLFAALSAQPGYSVYIVQSGDSVGSIAQQVGVTARSLAEANGGDPQMLIAAGLPLLVPPSRSPTPTG